MNKNKNFLNWDISIGRISLAEKASFVKNLSVMIKSGMTISESLAILEKSTKGKLKKIISRLLKSVRSGNSLSDSFSQFPKVFSGLFINVTYAGEKSGSLDESLENIALQLDKERELSSKIKGAMIYPAVVLTAAFFLGLAMAFFVLPKITPLFQGLNMELPLSTKFLIAISDFVQNYGGIFFASLIVGLAFLIWLFRQKFFKPVLHYFFLKMPIINKISRGSNLARFCRSLHILLRSGLNIDEAFTITEKTLGNFYYRRAAANIARDVGRGGKISESLERYKKYFPVMAVKMIKVGERSGRLEETFEYLSSYYEGKVDNATRSLSTAIEPVLLILIGLVVVFLALAIITPIYNITGQVR